jgi:CRISPR-associated protein Csy2
MSYTYLILKRLQVQNANAQPVAWLIGPPAVTSYVGFAQALTLAINAEKHSGIAIVHHDIQFLGEVEKNTLYPHQYRSASFIDKEDYASSNKYALSMQPTARCHLTVSVVIRFEPYVPVNLLLVKKFLRQARLAGGVVVEHRFSETDEACLLEDQHDLDKVIKTIGSGFAIHYRDDLRHPRPEDHDMLGTFLRVTQPSRERSPEDAWVIPTALGFAQITPLRQRKNVRGDFPHAYAESLIGFIQYRSLRQQRTLPFWRYTWPEEGVFLVSTH